MALRGYFCMDYISKWGFGKWRYDSDEKWSLLLWYNGKSNINYDNGNYIQYNEILDRVK